MDKLTLGYVHPLIPFRDVIFGNLESEFDQFFSEFFNPSRSKKVSSRSYPKVDMYTKDSDLFIEFAIPGLTKDQIEITMEDSLLTISGQDYLSKEDNNKNWHIHELKKSKFSRSFTMPENCGEPEASLENGILTLIFKDVINQKKPQKRLIDIK